MKYAHCYISRKYYLRLSRTERTRTPIAIQLSLLRLILAEIWERKQNFGFTLKGALHTAVTYTLALPLFATAPLYLPPSMVRRQFKCIEIVIKTEMFVGVFRLNQAKLVGGWMLSLIHPFGTWCIILETQRILLFNLDWLGKKYVY